MSDVSIHEVVKFYKSRSISASVMGKIDISLIEYCIAFADADVEIDDVTVDSETGFRKLWDYTNIDWDYIEGVTGKTVGDLLIIHSVAVNGFLIFPDGTINIDLKPFVVEAINA